MKKQASAAFAIATLLKLAFSSSHLRCDPGTQLRVASKPYERAPNSLCEGVDLSRACGAKRPPGAGVNSSKRSKTLKGGEAVGRKPNSTSV